MASLHFFLYYCPHHPRKSPIYFLLLSFFSRFWYSAFMYSVLSHAYSFCILLNVMSPKYIMWREKCLNSYKRDINLWYIYIKVHCRYLKIIKSKYYIILQQYNIISLLRNNIFCKSWCHLFGEFISLYVSLFNNGLICIWKYNNDILNYTILTSYKVLSYHSHENDILSESYMY